MQAARFTIRGRFPGKNEMVEADRASKYGGNKLKQEQTDRVAWLAKYAKLPRFECRVRIVFRWIEPRWNRDSDNISAAVKYIMDGLVRAGVLKDDKIKHVGALLHYFPPPDPADPRVEIRIVPEVQK